jgi:hypothetical protein
MEYPFRYYFMTPSHTKKLTGSQPEVREFLSTNDGGERFEPGRIRVI